MCVKDLIALKNEDIGEGFERRSEEEGE